MWICFLGICGAVSYTDRSHGVYLAHQHKAIYMCCEMGFDSSPEVTAFPAMSVIPHKSL